MMLALGDGWSIALTAGQWVFNVVFTAALWYIGIKQRESSEQRAELKRTAAELVDSRMSLATAEVRTQLGVICEQIRQINARLERGDDAFDVLGEKGGSLENRLILRMAEMEKSLIQSCASKADLVRLSERFDGLQRAVAAAGLERSRT